MVPQHKLEIWPGYVTAVQEFEGGIMLCCDVSHKVLRTQTAHELMKDVINQKGDVQAGVQKALLGAVILTRYNNKCYRQIWIGCSFISKFLFGSMFKYLNNGWGKLVFSCKPKVAEMILK